MHTVSHLYFHGRKNTNEASWERPTVCKLLAFKIHIGYSVSLTFFSSFVVIFIFLSFSVGLDESGQIMNRSSFFTLKTLYGNCRHQTCSLIFIAYTSFIAHSFFFPGKGSKSERKAKGKSSVPILENKK